MGMTPEVEVEILKLKLRIAELELALERVNKGMVYFSPKYVPARPCWPEPLHAPPYITYGGIRK